MAHISQPSRWTTPPSICRVKVLLPYNLVGALIGKNGAMIKQLEFTCKCLIHVSGAKDLFPGTRDRVCVISGELVAVSDCFARILKHLHDQARRSARFFNATFAVPNSRVRSLVGPRGAAARLLVDMTGCWIKVSHRVPKMLERLVCVSGLFNSLMSAGLSIVHTILSNSNVADNLQTRYSVDLPLGVWWGATAVHASNAELLHPADAGHHTKRYLIKYLQETAPSHLLMQHSLLCCIKNALKSKSHQDLVSAVRDTWEHFNAQTKAPESFGSLADTAKGYKEESIDHEAFSASEDDIPAQVYRRSPCTTSQPVRSMRPNNQPFSPQAETRIDPPMVSDSSRQLPPDTLAYAFARRPSSTSSTLEAARVPFSSQSSVMEMRTRSESCSTNSANIERATDVVMPESDSDREEPGAPLHWHERRELGGDGSEPEQPQDGRGREPLTFVDGMLLATWDLLEHVRTLVGEQYAGGGACGSSLRTCGRVVGPGDAE